MEILADELLLNCLQYLDAKALTHIMQTCKRLHRIGQDKSLWQAFYSQTPFATALVEAAGIDTALKEGIIDYKTLMINILSDNVDALTALLLGGEQTRTFRLWVASYEKSPPKFFFTVPNHPRSLFLSKNIALNTIPNKESIQSWFITEVAVNAEKLKQLITKKGTLSYEGEIARASSPTLQNKILTN
nr:F-box protein [Legionella sp. PL877]